LLGELVRKDLARGHAAAIEPAELRDLATFQADQVAEDLGDGGRSFETGKASNYTISSDPS